LAGIAEDLAASSGASIICFKEFSEEELPNTLPLTNFEFTRCASLPSCLLRLPYADFDEYQSSMRSGYRRQLNTTGLPPAGDAIRLRLDSLGPYVEQVFPLYEQVMDRAEFKLEHLNMAFFRHLSRGMAEETRVLLLEEAAGDLLAAAVLLRGPRRTTFLATGIDYERCRPLRGYEKLVTGVVSQAIQWGADEVELGQTSWTLKTRFGAVPTSRHLFFKHAKPLGNRILGPVLPLLFPERSFPPRRVFSHEA
jgi:hypothetical protein